MRVTSNSVSVSALEPSVGAFIETIAAVCFSVFIAITLNTSFFIILGVVVAPILLLRTERSVDRGIIYFEASTKYIQKKFDDNPETVWALVYLLYIPLAALASRAASTAVTVFRHPILSFKSIPSNWFRYACCIDICYPPEVVPEADLRCSNEEIKFRRVIKDAYVNFRDEEWRWKPLVAVVSICTVVVLYLPAIALRLSLKSTALLCVPMLWLIHLGTRPTDNIYNTLYKIRKGDIGRITVIYSCFLIAAFLAKIVAMSSWADFSHWLAVSVLGNVFYEYIAPSEVPIWQLVAAINSLLAIVMFWFSGESLLRREISESWDTSRVILCYRVLSITRGILTFYILACTGYIALDLFHEWNLPPLGIRLFPWV